MDAQKDDKYFPFLYVCKIYFPYPSFPYKKRYVRLSKTILRMCGPVIQQADWPQMINIKLAY